MVHLDLDAFYCLEFSQAVLTLIAASTDSRHSLTRRSQFSVVSAR